MAVDPADEPAAPGVTANQMRELDRLAVKVQGSSILQMMDS